MMVSDRGLDGDARKAGARQAGSWRAVGPSGME